MLSQLLLTSLAAEFLNQKPFLLEDLRVILNFFFATIVIFSCSLAAVVIAVITQIYRPLHLVWKI